MGSHYKGTQNQIRALNTYIKFSRAFDSVKTRLDQKNISGAVSETQFGALEALYHLGALTQKDIGEKLLISKSNVVAVIDKLEDANLVKRQRSSEDRRFIFIHLTEEGRTTIEELLPYHVASIVEEMSCLTPDEQEELGRLCRKLGLRE
jgi:MarR family transcriptional regulator, 2-MHQ and catechol-resistance regulon repressor